MSIIICTRVPILYNSIIPLVDAVVVAKTAPRRESRFARLRPSSESLLHALVLRRSNKDRIAPAPRECKTRVYVRLGSYCVLKDPVELTFLDDKILYKHSSFRLGIKLITTVIIVTKNSKGSNCD